MRRVVHRGGAKAAPRRNMPITSIHKKGMAGRVNAAAESGGGRSQGRSFKVVSTKKTLMPAGWVSATG